MHVAMGMIAPTEEDLQFARQIGVTHLVTRPAYRLRDGYYAYEDLVQLRTRVEAAGLHVAAIHDVPAEWNAAIRRGSADRDDQLNNYCRSVENVGRAGIKILGYSFHAVRVWRTTRHARGRGAALYTGYDHRLVEDAPRHMDGALDADAMWDNYRRFAERVVPVAESAGVRLALHPDDPPMPQVAGDACIFSNVDAFQRALDTVQSPANGLLFCQGCFAEMLGGGVYDAIRTLGSTGKVAYVHFRNIVGRLPVFREAAIDAGDIDMIEAMRTWQAVGFDGPMMPDHYGHMVGDSAYGHRARAHGIGYMKALMQAVGALPTVTH